MLALLAALATTAFGGGSDPYLIAQHSKPNILFIITDDQRLGGTMDVMPNTRRLFMSQGTTFPNGYVTTSVCCPSRSTIMSGRYAHNTGVLRNTEAANFDQNLSLQHYLQQQGYTTGIFGKFLNDWDLNVNPSYWDRWAIYNNSDYIPKQVNEQGVVKTVNEYSTSYVSDQATQFIEQQESDDRKPWFAYVAPEAPHFPSQPDTKYANASTPPFQQPPSFFEQDRSDKPPWVQSDNEDQNAILNERIAHLRTLKSVDDMVGRIFSTLNSTGETRDTLAVFMSDNGWLWGEHGIRGKARPYLEAIDVPFYMRWPNHIRAGATDSRYVGNVDLAPTASDVIGVPPSYTMDGKSILNTSNSRDHTLTEFWGPGASTPTPPFAAILTPTYHYIEYYQDDLTTVMFREYYNLTNDPYELTNLLNDGDPNNDPPTAALSAELAADRTCVGSGCP